MTIETSLLDLPDEMLVYIARQHSGQAYLHSINNLSKSCKTLYGFFQPELEKLAAKKLAQHILWGEKHEACNFLAQKPQLLFMKTTAMDYALGFDGSRRIIVASPYQAILGAGDTDMLQALPPILKRIKDGEALAREQFDQQFPYDLFQPNTPTYDFSALINAISQDQFVNHCFSEPTRLALEHFRDHFKPTTHHSGYHFDLQTLIHAYTLYAQYHPQWDAPHQSFFFRLVIGYLQRLVSTCDAQIFCQGIFNVVAYDKPIIQRTLKLCDGQDYFPNVTTPTLGLGVDFGASTCLRSLSSTHMIHDCDWHLHLLKQLHQMKTQSLHNFRQQLQGGLSFSP